MCVLGESNFKGWVSTVATANCGTHQHLSYFTQVYKLCVSWWLAWHKTHQMSFWPLYHRLVPYTPVQLEAGLSWPKRHAGEKTTCNFPQPRPANSSKAIHVTDRVILAHTTADIKNVLNYATAFPYIFKAQSFGTQQFLHVPKERNLPSILTLNLTVWHLTTHIWVAPHR